MEEVEEPLQKEARTAGETDMGDEKRAITYEIAKNKGLTPHKRKELRNPRVKHRMKFRKAKIRRRGQVCLFLSVGFFHGGISFAF